MRKAAVDVNSSTGPQRKDFSSNSREDLSYAAPPRHPVVQYLRITLFAIFFTFCCLLYVCPLPYDTQARLTNL